MAGGLWVSWFLGPECDVLLSGFWWLLAWNCSFPNTLLTNRLKQPYTQLFTYPCDTQNQRNPRNPSNKLLLKELTFLKMSFFHGCMETHASLKNFLSSGHLKCVVTELHQSENQMCRQADLWHSMYTSHEYVCRTHNTKILVTCSLDHKFR